MWRRVRCWSSIRRPSHGTVASCLRPRSVSALVQRRAPTNADPGSLIHSKRRRGHDEPPPPGLHSTVGSQCTLRCGGNDSAVASGRAGVRLMSAERHASDHRPRVGAGGACTSPVAGASVRGRRSGSRSLPPLVASTSPRQTVASTSPLLPRSSPLSFPPSPIVSPLSSSCSVHLCACSPMRIRSLCSPMRVRSVARVHRGEEQPAHAPRRLVHCDG